MPAQAGIQGREGMDTGFRRYDETFVPSRGPEPTCTCIFEGGTEFTEFRIISNRNRFTPHPRGDSSGNLITGDPIEAGDSSWIARLTGQQNAIGCLLGRLILVITLI